MSYNPGSNRRGQFWPDTSWLLVQKVHSSLQLNRSLLWQISELNVIASGTMRTLTSINQPEEAPLCWKTPKWAGNSRERDLATKNSLVQEDSLVLLKWGSTSLLETPGQAIALASKSNHNNYTTWTSLLHPQEMGASFHNKYPPRETSWPLWVWDSSPVETHPISCLGSPFCSIK